MKSIMRSVKIALARAGGALSPGAVRSFRLAAGYVAVGRWVAENGWSGTPRVNSRNRVFDSMQREVGDQPICYLEFGVFEGHSFRYWLRLNSHAESQFHGFDSFEGLPETFDSTYQLRAFDLGGKPPDIEDPRARFHVGWFDETLPTFEVPDLRLVIVLDADLYSATKLVLDALDDHIRPGTLIYFDELSRIDHEPAAFDDYRTVTGKTFEPVSFEDTLNTGAFICR